MSGRAKNLNDYPEGLVRSWLEVELCIPGRRRVDAIREIKEEFSMTLTHSRLNEWLSGKVAPPREVRRYMARCAIGRVLRSECIDTTNLDDEKLERIADRLS